MLQANVFMGEIINRLYKLREVTTLLKTAREILEQNGAYLEIEGRDCLDCAIELHARIVPEIVTLAEQAESAASVVE